jgi:hypothetical protein
MKLQELCQVAILTGVDIELDTGNAGHNHSLQQKRKHHATQVNEAAPCPDPDPFNGDDIEDFESFMGQE